MKNNKHTDIVPVESEYKRLIEEILELELKIAAMAEEIDDRFYGDWRRHHADSGYY